MGKKEDVIKEEKEEIVETPKKKATRKAKKKTPAQIRKILKDSEAIIINNSDGSGVYYRDDITGIEIDLPAYGDTDVVEIEVLRKLNVKSKSFFKNYWLLIIDFMCDDETITLDDVYDYVGISKFYKSFGELKEYEDDMPNEDYFEDLLLEKSTREFKKVLEKMNKELLTQLFNRAVTLYKEGKFSDSFKIMALEEKTNREEFFRDIKIEDEDK